MTPDAITQPPPPNPPQPLWIERCAQRIRERDPCIAPAMAREEAGYLFEVARGEYTPEQAADVSTGFLEPAREHLHLFDGALGGLVDQGRAGG